MLQGLVVFSIWATAAFVIGVFLGKALHMCTVRDQPSPPRRPEMPVWASSVKTTTYYDKEDKS